MTSVADSPAVAPPTTTPAKDRGPARQRARTLLGQLLGLEWPTRQGALLQPFARAVRTSVRWEASLLATELGLATPPVRRIADLQRTLAAAFTALPPVTAAVAERHLDLAPLPATLRALTDRRFCALQRVARALQATTGVRCLLHGSLASDDWTPYRDADLLLLVDRATCTDTTALDRLRRACLPLLRALHAFDPLQHHGPFVLPADELGAYPEQFLPIATLERALDLGGDGTRLTLRPLQDRAIAVRQLDWIADRLARAERPRDAYGWKALASVVMLLPVCHLAARGQPGWKGDSFADLAPHVPDELWWPQEWATALRAGWRDRTPWWLRQLLRIAPNPRALALLGRRLTQAPAQLLPADWTALQQTAHALAIHLRCRATP